MKVLRRVLFFLSLLCMAAGGYGALTSVYEYYAGRQEYEKIRGISVLEEMAESTEHQKGSGRDPVVDRKNGSKPVNGSQLVGHEINEQELKEINPDYSAWITVPGTPIDYPVVMGGDNSYYLNHTFSGKANMVGTIFIDASCMLFETENTVIYGHNMKDKSMFGSLRYYLEEGYYRGHKEILLYQGGSLYKFKIFSVILEPDGKSKAYVNGFGSIEEKQEFINEMIKRSRVHIEGEKPKETDWLLTLSTCTSSGDGRLLILAAAGENEKG